MNTARILSSAALALARHAASKAESFTPIAIDLTSHTGIAWTGGRWHNFDELRPCAFPTADSIYPPTPQPFDTFDRYGN